MNAMDETPHVVSSENAFEGAVFRVRVDRVRYGDGRTHRVDVVEHGGSYAIVATTDDDRIVLVRQYRHAARRSLWEIPAGMAEPDESLSEGAKRELREETGYRANDIRALGAMFVTPGFCTERLHFFHASGLIAGAQELDSDERIAVASFALDEAQRLLDGGQIADAKTVIALLWMHGSRGQLVNHYSR